MKTILVTTATIRYDVNGNKIVSMQFIRRRGFSIQTNGNLKQLNRLPVGYTFTAHSDTALWREIIAYLYQYGTKNQKTYFASLNNDKVI